MVLKNVTFQLLQFADTFTLSKMQMVQYCQ